MRGLRWLPGIVVPGWGVASGRAGAASPYPAGSIALQSPFFAAHGIDLAGYFPGTLNVDVAPHAPQLRDPVFDARLRWWGTLEERFLLAKIALRCTQGTFDGLWYHPHPATKPAHAQKPTVVELLLPWIPGLGTGANVEVGLPEE